MAESSKYYLVAAEALPEIFLKVEAAKDALENGDAKSIGEAVKRVGISRSAFYKYKDSIRPFNDMAAGRIITFHALLKDAPGVLSDILGIFAVSGANILTINQNIPVGDRASATICASTAGMRVTVEELMQRAQNCRGVLRFETVAG